jgi:hypothetical protein
MIILFFCEEKKKSTGTMKREKLKSFPSAKTVVMLKENEILMLKTGLGKSTLSSFLSLYAKEIHNHNLSMELYETLMDSRKQLRFYYVNTVEALDIAKENRGMHVGIYFRCHLSYYRNCSGGTAGIVCADF